MRSDDWFIPLNIGRTALEWRLRAIDSATESIDLQTFLWSNDAVGDEISQALIAAANRGVTVKLLLDDSFTVNESEFLATLNRHPNIDTRIYNPFHYRPDNVAIREMFNLGEFSRIDRRMHNKVLVIDNIASIIGGRNQADEYFGHHAKANFRDMEVLAYGEVSQQISKSFDAYWNSGWAFPLETLGSNANDAQQPGNVPGGQPYLRQFLPVESTESLASAWRGAATTGFGGQASLLVDAPAGETPSVESATLLAAQMLRWIDQAEHELIAVSAYLIPTQELQQAVERALARGVKIKILTNSLQSNNHTSAHAAYRHHITQLLELGVEVYELRAFASGRALYMDAPVESKSLGLHAKFMLIDDDVSFIGSANLDARSLKLNTEIGLMIRSAALNGRVRELIAHDFQLSNAWLLQQRDGGSIVWVGDSITHKEQPSDSTWQRLEDWFFGLLPIENEM
ncbi:MAG: phospholipase D family protein [Halioglobus sp.]